MRTFADAELALEAALPGYERRDQQRELAERIESLMASPYGAGGPRVMFGQAPTGTGKSLAAAIPAILSGRRVVYSVTTKTLQSQLAEKDMPFLEEHLGVGFTWAVLKGRSNYFCRRVAADADDQPPSLRAVLEYAQRHEDWDGSRDSLPFQVPGHEWALISSDTDSCRNLECKDLEAEGVGGCYAETARAKARMSRLVIVNHALYLTDLMIKISASRKADEDDPDDDGWEHPGMLGRHELVILDEAHDFEKVAGDTLGGRLVEGTFRSLANEIRSWVVKFRSGDEDLVEKAQSASARLAMAAVDLFHSTPEDGYPTGRGLPKGTITTATLNKHIGQLAELGGAVADLIKLWENEATLDGVDPDDREVARRRRDKLSARLYSTDERLREVYSGDPDVVRWVTEKTVRRGERQREIRTCPISVAPILSEHLFAKTPAVMISATLAVRGGFSYMAERLGVRPGYDQIKVESPFDYDRQSRLYVAADLPEPRNDRWEGMANERILDLVRASEGRALVLFTSRKHMLSAVDQIGDRVSSDYELLVQGEAEVPVLAARFKSDVHSVLFGLDSFFTGFDVQGEALSHLIITKAPFTAPDDPLYAARCERLERDSGDRWAGFKYGVSLMSLKLQQGDGRLIRHRDDRGVVSFLDPRFEKSSWGSQVLKDLPARPRVYDVSQIRDFLAEA